MTEALDPETLERLRRGIPLRLDRTGQFHLGDEPVIHPRVRAAFLAGLDHNDAGEPTLHVGNQWCYLTVDDCPLRATGILPDPDGALTMRLDDGRTVPLDPTTVRVDDEGLRCLAPSQPTSRPIPVRLGNTAAMDLSAFIEGDGDTATLVVGSQRIALRR
ncbi:MAG TPA: hypothetical protein VGB85_12940 [Nannocystis sp.]